jgi:hypothetical protein
LIDLDLDLDVNDTAGVQRLEHPYLVLETDRVAGIAVVDPHQYSIDAHGVVLPFASHPVA